jgi:hypothetical protein
MRRWLVLAALLFCVAAFCEMVLNSPQLSAFFYVPSMLSMPVNIVTAVCWIGLVGRWGDRRPANGPPVAVQLVRARRPATRSNATERR